MLGKITEDDEKLPGVRIEVPEVEPDEVVERLRPGFSLADQALDYGKVAVGGLVEDGEEDPVLAAEVVVKGPLGDAGLAGDFRRRGIPVPFFGKQTGRDRQDGGALSRLPQDSPPSSGSTRLTK